MSEHKNEMRQGRSGVAFARGVLGWNLEYGDIQLGIDGLCLWRIAIARLL